MAFDGKNGPGSMHRASPPASQASNPGWTRSAAITPDLPAAAQDAAPPPQPPTPPRSLTARALHGSAWTIGGHAAGQFIRLANNLALTRLIAPDLIGLMGTVHVFLAGLHLMSDFGVGPAIIQNPRGEDRRFCDTAWTLHVLRGALIWLVMLPLGPLLARIYADQPGAERLTWLVPVVGTTALIAGLHSTAIYTLNRHLRLRPVVLLDIGSQILGCAAGLAWAYLDPSLWALVAGVLVHQITYTVASHFLGVRNRLQWDREAARTVAKFGRWIWMSTMLTWAAGQVDRMVMPMLLNFDGLAVYQVALLIAAAAPGAAHELGSRVVLPVLSELVRREDRALSQKLLRARVVIVLPAVAGLLLLSLFGEPLIRFLYRGPFQDAGWMLRLLAAGAIPQVVTASSWQAFFAMGRSFVPMCLQAAKLVLKASAMVVGHLADGPHGVIVGLLVAEALHYPFVALALRPYGVFQPRLDVPVLLGSAAIVAVGLWLW